MFDIAGFALVGVKGPLKWEQLPSDAKNKFLMDGKIALKHHYLQPNTNKQEQRETDYSSVWSDGNIENLMHLAAKRVGWKEGYPCGYPLAPDDFYDALDRFPQKGKTVLVVGSESPWLEAIILAYGQALRVVTVDFKAIPQNAYVQTMTVDQLAKSNLKFDSVLSFSSIEHDGLGRYGDPINPDADLERMKAILSMMSEDAFMFLGVPIGKDTLVWNAHRIYGRQRFPLLTTGWTAVALFGGSPDDLDAEVPDISYHFQPLWVFRKNQS